MENEHSEGNPVSEESILGTFPSPVDTAKAMEALKEAGMEEVCLYSPIDPGEIGLPVTQRKSRIGRFTLMGVGFGIFVGLFLGGGTALLYPIETGGMPILSLPAIGIITFEMMILFALLATVGGFIYCAFLSPGQKDFVPERVSSDRFGVSVKGSQKQLASATDILKRCGADRVEKQIARLWIGVSLVLIIPSLVLGFPWTQDMVDQAARDPQEERVSLLPSRVPRHGKSIEILSKDEGLWIENPVSATETSIHLGKRLFKIFCVVCHGSDGKGDGLIAEKIGEFPDFTQQEFRSQPDGCFFVAITNGANFTSEISRPRPSAEMIGHDDHDDGSGHDHGDEDEHMHDEMESMSHGQSAEHEDDHGQEHEPSEHAHNGDDEHSHDETKHAHEDEETHEHNALTTLEQEHDDHSDDHMPASEESEHAHVEDSDHGHDASASMNHEHEDDHGHEDEHAHGSEGKRACFEGGHGHGEDSGPAHAHGSGKKHFMPPYRDSLNPVERWHIVNFMKHGLVRK